MMKLNKQLKRNAAEVSTLKYVEYGKYNDVGPKFVYEMMDHYTRLLNRNGNRPFCTFHCFYNFNMDLPESFIREWYIDYRNYIKGVYECFILKDRMLEVLVREKKGKYFARMVVSDVSDFGNGKTIEVATRVLHVYN